MVSFRCLLLISTIHCKAYQSIAFAQQRNSVPLQHITTQFHSAPLQSLTSLSFAFATPSAAFPRQALPSAFQSCATAKRLIAIHNHCLAIHYFSYAVLNTTMLCLCPAKRCLTIQCLSYAKQDCAVLNLCYAFICSLPSYIFATLRHIEQPFLFASDINIPIVARFNASA